VVLGDGGLCAVFYRWRAVGVGGGDAWALPWAEDCACVLRDDARGWKDCLRGVMEGSQGSTDYARGLKEGLRGSIDCLRGWREG
jgi:hypothetical protein